MKKIIALILALTMSAMLLAGCGGTQNSQGGTEVASGGKLLLRVNPEIAISYDNDGLVTAVAAVNDDGGRIIESYTGYEGKAAKEVVKELVTKIGEAGFFVEEVEGEKRQITIEIEKGSRIPNQTFIDDVVNEVRSTVSKKEWHSPVDVMGESDFGITDYIDTDYGMGNDGNTDYADFTDYGANTDYGAGNDGFTDYGNTDYGPKNDGITDYDRDTDYGLNNDGFTDYYNDTDYGANNDGVTDYIDTDYGVGNDGVTDFGKTDYGNTDYAVAPAPTPAPTPAAPPAGGSDYGTNYDSHSNYGSNYGDSGYDD